MSKTGYQREQRVIINLMTGLTEYDGHVYEEVAERVAVCR